MEDLYGWRDEWALVLAGKVTDGTSKVYLRGTNQFLNFLRDEHPEITEVAQVQQRHLEHWNTTLANLGRSKATRRVRLLSIQAWFNYLAKAEDCDVTHNPVVQIDLPVPVRNPPPVIHDEDLVKLIKACKGRAFVDYRDEAIIRLLLDTGMRRAELVGIELPDLDLQRREVEITRKGGKRQTLVFASNTALALTKYLRARRQRPAADSRRLFLSVRPSESGSSHLTGGGVGEMVTRRAQQAGLDRTWPHKLRHTWAHDFLANGGNEQDCERLGGWSPGSNMVKWYGSSQGEHRARSAAKSLARGNRL